MVDMGALINTRNLHTGKMYFKYYRKKLLGFWKILLTLSTRNIKILTVPPCNHLWTWIIFQSRNLPKRYHDWSEERHYYVRGRSQTTFANFDNYWPPTYLCLHWLTYGLSSTYLSMLTCHNVYPTVKSRAVDRSTIQFWNFLAKGHST